MLVFVRVIVDITQVIVVVRHGVKLLCKSVAIMSALSFGDEIDPTDASLSTGPTKVLES